MKAHNFIRLVLYFTLGFTILNCSLEEVTNNETLTNVSFVNSTHTMTQEMESITIPLKLDVKAVKDGYITIELTGNATYGSDFITEPQAQNNQIYLKLLTNTKDTSFVVSRVNALTSEKVINLRLSSPTVGFSLGNRVISEVKLNPLPIIVNHLNFNGSTETISENISEGMVIGLSMTSSVSNGNMAKVKITAPQGITYGTHFYTVPAATLNEIQIEFGQNAQNPSFKVIPVNDNLILGDYNIVFELIEANGGLVIGEHKNFTLTVTEDDQVAGVINTIAELRSKFNEYQGEWYLPQDYIIEGVITSNGNTLDSKSVYIQDATAGILIRFTAPNIFNVGDKIRLNLKNGTGTLNYDQKCINGVNLYGYVKYAENIPVYAETITIDQLHSGNYDGKRVKIENVHFVDANGTTKFLGNHAIRHEDTGAIVAVYATAPFSDYVLPQGTISISGIVGDYGRILPQIYTHDITN